MNQVYKVLPVLVGLIFLSGAVSGAEPVTNTPQRSSPKSQKASRKKKVVVKRKKQLPAKIEAVPNEGTAVEKKEIKRKDSLSQWLNKMKKRVAHSQAKHNQIVAVAAVRGDKTADSTPLYWKGKTSEKPVEMPELKAFDEAIDVALKGDNVTAKTKLEAFVSAYPQSPLVSEAQETLNLLGGETTTP